MAKPYNSPIPGSMIVYLRNLIRPKLHSARRKEKRKSTQVGAAPAAGFAPQPPTAADHDAAPAPQRPPEAAKWAQLQQRHGEFYFVGGK